MATFARKTFGYKGYASLRPSYPKGLYDVILAYHQGARNVALDLGCGHGIVTRGVGQHFAHTTGVDPSEGMLDQARTLTPPSQYPGITYRQGGAEDLSFTKSSSVDAVVSGQAAHWFDQSRLWPELARIMRPGGTVSFWSYELPKFRDYPAANAIVDKYGYGPILGAYWPGNGATIIKDKLAAIQPPDFSFEQVTRVSREPGEPLNLEDGGESFVVRFKLSIGALGRYWRTNSAFYVWQDAHPDRKSRESGGSGDVIDDFLDDLGQLNSDLKDVERVVDLEFTTTIFLARRK